MKHFILTRINTGYLNNVQDPDAWFDIRMKLFSEIAVPSIKNQINQNFTWLLYIDPKTKFDHLLALKNAVIRMRNVEIINYPPRFYILDNFPKEKILTTRFDSDDALDRAFVSTTQYVAVNATYDTCVINYPTGIYYFTDKGQAFAGYKKFVNQFTSMVERDFEHTVLCKQHTDLDKFYPTIWYPTKDPMWLWLIHGNQISKTTKDYLGALDTPKELPNFKIQDFIGG